MNKTIPFFAALTAVSVWAWACSSSDEPAAGTVDAGADAPAITPGTDGGNVPDVATIEGECVGVDASVPSGDFGDPNTGAPADAGALYTNVPFPTENTYSYEKAVLGKILFWEEQMSSDDTVACGSCHHPASGGSVPTSGRHPGADGVIGTGDDPHGGRGIARCDDSSGTVVRKSDALFGSNAQVTRRKPPSYLDAMFSVSLFWDGRANDAFLDPENVGTTVIATGGALESQVVQPPMNDVEMACEQRTWAKLEAKLTAAKPLAKAKSIPPELMAAICKAGSSYPELFRAAFGTPDITAAKIAKAIATHERTLISNQTPYDKDLGGDTTALTDAQKRGRDLFIGSGLCQRCHQPPNFGFTKPGAQLYVNLGFESDAGVGWDKGRAEQTDAGTDVGTFRTVTLRNVGLREAQGLLHDGIGSGADLATLVAAYSNPPGNNYNTSPFMTVKPNLDTQQQSDLVDFLRNGLTDPRVQNEQFPFDRPKLSSE